jgi:hypothetical protein
VSNVYIIFDDETGKPSCSCRRGASKFFCVGIIALPNDKAVALSWCMVDSESSPSRRWAYALLGLHYGMTLLSMIWILLPDDLRNLLVNALSR